MTFLNKRQINIWKTLNLNCNYLCKREKNWWRGKSEIMAFVSWSDVAFTVNSRCRALTPETNTGVELCHWNGVKDVYDLFSAFIIYWFRTSRPQKKKKPTSRSLTAVTIKRPTGPPLCLLISTGSAAAETSWVCCSLVWGLKNPQRLNCAGSEQCFRSADGLRPQNCDWAVASWTVSRIFPSKMFFGILHILILFCMYCIITII